MKKRLFEDSKNSKKMSNKKAQMTTFQLLSLVLGAVVLIVVILGFTKGWGFFTDFFGKADVDVTFISQKCSALIAAGATKSYCAERIEIGRNNYVNCPYAVKVLGASVEGNPPSCNEEDGAKAICERLKLEQGENFNSEKIKVNGKSCRSREVFNCGEFKDDKECNKHTDKCNWDATKKKCVENPTTNANQQAQ